RVANELKEQIETLHRDKGAAVVLDADTGDVLACVSYPWPKSLAESSDGDPEADEQSAADALVDRARWGINPPGSTFKLVTAIAALRKGLDPLNERFTCRALADGRVGNYVRGWGRPIRDDVMDHVPHGMLNMEEGLVKSCNAYFAQLGVKVGAQMLLATADRLGLEFTRRVNLSRVRDALPQAAYGQGPVYSTAFQMARVAATIGNNGNMAYSRWMLDDSNDRARTPVAVLDSQQARTIGQYMRGVVTRGTGRVLGGNATAIAGKTGTAEVEGAPSHAWFVGFAPYDSDAKKRIAFCVLIENGRYGGSAAAPVAGR